MGGAAPTAPNGVNNGFANLLKQGLEKVNETQSKASDARDAVRDAACPASNCRR